MFSNHSRVTKVILCLVTLSLLGWYAILNYPRQCNYYGDALRFPELCSGRIVVAGQSTIDQLVPGGFLVTLHLGDPPVFVPYQGNDAHIGSYVDLLGRFTSETGFEPLAVHVYFDRIIKLSVSLAAAVIMLLYFIFAFASHRR